MFKEIVLRNLQVESSCVMVSDVSGKQRKDLFKSTWELWDLGNVFNEPSSKCA